MDKVDDLIFWFIIPLIKNQIIWFIEIISLIHGIFPSQVSFFYSTTIFVTGQVYKWEYFNERSRLSRQRTIEKVNEARKDTEESRHRETAESAPMKGRNLVNGSAVRDSFFFYNLACCSGVRYDTRIHERTRILRDRGQ